MDNRGLRQLLALRETTLFSWVSQILINVLVSFAFENVVRLLVAVGHATLPNYIPAFPDGPWPTYILLANFLAMGFLLEIAIAARQAVSGVRIELRKSLATDMADALERANMHDVLSRFIVTQEHDESIRESGERIVNSLRRFATNQPESQRAFVLWLFSRRLPNELYLLSQSLQGDGLSVYVAEEIEAEKFLAKSNGCFRYIEHAIPTVFEAYWTEGWLAFMSELKSLCPKCAEYNFVTTREELRQKQSSFVMAHDFFKKNNIELYWCDIGALTKGTGITKLRADPGTC